MKNKLYYLKPCIWLIITTLFLSACEEEPTGGVDIAGAIEGQWNAEEDSEVEGTSSYTVYIDIHSDDSSSVSISNFYQLGYDSNPVIGDISGSRIELRPNQVVDYYGVSYTIESGTGTITDDYKNIDWQYKVDDGSGVIDNVTAVYTKK